MRHSYDQWMILVNLELVKLCGMDYDMLPDYCYRDEYNAGVSPKECAENALEYAKDF